MGLNVVRRVKQDKMGETDRINLDDTLSFIKVEEFISSCKYDIEQGDLGVLDFRVHRFLMKNEDLEQMVWKRLFKEIWNPEGSVFYWLIKNMDKKTLERILKRIGEANMDNVEDECEFDSFQFDTYEEGEEYEGEEYDFECGLVECDEREDDDGWDEFQKLWEE